MDRWLIQYIEKKQEHWEKERLEREIERERKEKDWEKIQRFEEIRKIR